MLSPGARLGAYEVGELLGSGGMGQVYRARDTRLLRDVAIKVLPAAVAAEPERLGRFRREAQVLASLNHPHIAAVYGFEEDAGVHALVLELVEGPTLAERIALGAMPAEEALPIAREIAQALEAAHHHGIVHRDLKPANIKMTPSGAVKVLDFGLAKALDAPGSGVGSGSNPPSHSLSPTITTPALMTGAGAILGTAAYMSPEQARGKTADTRADIWSFGCVLYEMLTGRRAFDGDAVTEALAAILRAEPDWSALPLETRAPIRRLLRRCLEKDRDRRLQAIGDARLEIDEALSGAPPAENVQAAAVRAGSRWLLPVAAALGAAALVGTAAWMTRPAPARDARPVTRSLIAVNPFARPSPQPERAGTTSPPRPNRTAVAISPDGRTLVVRAAIDGSSQPAQLYLRHLDRLEWTPIPDTAGASNPFFSPDGTSVGFVADGALRRVRLTGGPPTPIVTVADGPVFGATWSDQDVILFATQAGIYRVAAGGGTATLIVKPPPSESGRYLPHALPGGNGFLYTALKTTFDWADARIVWRSLQGDDEKVVLEDAADARYLQSGHLLFARRGALMVAPFDMTARQVRGGAVTVARDVMQAVNFGNTGAESGAAQVTASAGGTLLYATGGVAPDRPWTLVWVDRGGHIEPLGTPEREFTAPRLSPDGTRIAVTVMQAASGRRQGIWMYDVATRALSPLTAEAESALWSPWSPDGGRLALAIMGKGTFIRALSGGSDVKLPDSQPTSWSPDGKQLTVVVQESNGAVPQIAVIDLKTPGAAPRVFAPESVEQGFPAFSPDGKWIAYTSSASGRNDVYIQPYPGPGARIPVSPDGGHSPAWRADGAELYYVRPGGRDRPGITMYAVPLRVDGTTLRPGAPQALFEGVYGMSGPNRGYDVTPDGKRFLMVQPGTVPAEPPTELILVENWFEELRRLF